MGVLHVLQFPSLSPAFLSQMLQLVAEALWSGERRALFISRKRAVLTVVRHANLGAGIIGVTLIFTPYFGRDNKRVFPRVGNKFGFVR